MVAVVRRTPARWRGSVGRGEAALGAGMGAGGGLFIGGRSVWRRGQGIS